MADEEIPDFLLEEIREQVRATFDELQFTGDGTNIIVTKDGSNVVISSGTKLKDKKVEGGTTTTTASTYPFKMATRQSGATWYLDVYYGTVNGVAPTVGGGAMTVAANTSTTIGASAAGVWLEITSDDTATDTASVATADIQVLNSAPTNSGSGTASRTVYIKVAELTGDSTSGWGVQNLLAGSWLAFRAGGPGAGWGIVTGSWSTY